MRNALDDYLLELILMDTIAVTGRRPLAGVEGIIQRFLPAGLYDRVMARYDALSEGWADDDPQLLAPWLKKAAAKDSRWKRRMITQFLCILHTSGAIGPAEWAEVAALAAAMGAVQECRQVFSCHLPAPRRSISSGKPARNTKRNIAVPN